jgi:hypothetical protein
VNDSKCDIPSPESYRIAKQIMLLVFTALHTETDFLDCDVVVLQEHTASTFGVEGGIYKTAH